MADVRDLNFLLHYQSLLFRDISEDSFEHASIRRKCMALALQASLNWSSDALPLAIINDHLKGYGELVDARGPGTIDNYSASALAIALNSKNECSKWVSSFEESIQIPDLLKSILECDCNEVTNEDVKMLLDARGENGDESEESKINSNLSSSISFNFGNGSSFGENNSDASKGPKNIQAKHAGSGVNRQLLTDLKITKNVSEKVNPHQNVFTPRQKLQSGSEVSVVKTNKQNFSANDISSKNSYGHFISAREELSIQNQKKLSQGGQSGTTNAKLFPFRNQKRLGTSRRPINDEFVLPVCQKPGQRCSSSSLNSRKEDLDGMEEDERLKGIDPKMVEMVKNEIIDNGSPVDWDDIAGLDFAKTTIQEIVVWPLLRPDIFFGLRGPPKGILLFGPPGTGKTLIGKCIASQSKSTFFSISASSLTSKWIGEGEKMVRALFAVARCHPPAVIFIDEIDSLLTQRNETDHESSRRIKTEFLVQLDGAATSEDDRILVIGATNRPQELDEAARRRLVKRLYIPLPEFKARRQIIVKLMSSQRNNLTSEDIDEVAKLTEGYSGADMKNLCREAALGPIRSIRFEDIERIQPDQVRPVVLADFIAALSQVRASVSTADLNQYIAWNNQYGCVEPK